MLQHTVSPDALTGLRTGCHCRLPQRLRQAQPALRAQGRPSHSAGPAKHSHTGPDSCLPSRCSAAQRRRLQPPRAFYDKWLNSDSPEKTRKQYQRQVDQINALASQVAKLSDDELRAKTADFRRRYDQGESLDNLLVEVFAVRAETCTALKLQRCRPQPSSQYGSKHMDWRRCCPADACAAAGRQGGI